MGPGRAAVLLVAALAAAGAVPAAADHEPPRTTVLTTSSHRVVTTGACVPRGYTCAGLGSHYLRVQLRDLGSGEPLPGAAVVVRDADSEHVHCSTTTGQEGTAVCRVPDLDVVRHGGEHVASFAGTAHHHPASASGTFRFP